MGERPQKVPVQNYRFWDASADAADEPETESRPAAQTPTNRACFPDDARSTRQTPSNNMYVLCVMCFMLYVMRYVLYLILCYMLYFVCCYTS